MLQMIAKESGKQPITKIIDSYINRKGEGIFVTDSVGRYKADFEAVQLQCNTQSYVQMHLNLIKLKSTAVNLLFEILI